MSQPHALQPSNVNPPYDIMLTRKILDLAEAESKVLCDSAGAIVSFIGTTRNTHIKKNVLRLEYEAHEVLVSKVLTALCAHAIQQFDLKKICLYHRLGSLNVGEVSVIIAVSSAHRAAAFEGCRYLIDSLKVSAPIWKKEYYADGSEPAWVGPDGKPV